MAIHRAITMTQSAAEARLRNDVNHWSSVAQPSDICSCTDAPPTSNPERRSALTLSLDYSSRNPKRPSSSLPLPSDPTQPLLPTTRQIVESPSGTSPQQPADIEHIGIYGMPTTKSASGTYIGLLCLALIWLLPIGIIASRGTPGEVEAVSKSPVLPLFGRPAQVPIGGDTTLRPLIWEQMKRGEHCLRYKTREYVARSIGAGKGEAGIEECERTPAQIHDVELQPTFCEDLGSWGGIWGHWVVDFGEADCETKWVDFKDEGCQLADGLHRFTATLDGFKPDDDSLIMCSTTPTNFSFHDEQFSVPTNCQRLKDAVQGTWEVTDRSCTSTRRLRPDA